MSARTEHKITTGVMTCPVCRGDIEAEVHYEAWMSGPRYLGTINEVKVDPHTKLTRFNVTHKCRGRAEAAPTHPADHSPASEAAGEGES